MSNLSYVRTEKEYAAQYKKDVRTIRRYKKDGAPLDDAAAMDKYLASKQVVSAPPGETTFENLTDLGDAKIQKLRLECQRLAFRNEVERNKYVAVDQVKGDHIRIGNAMRAALKELVNDVPTWAGLPPTEAHAKAQQREGEIVTLLHELTSKLYQ